MAAERKRRAGAPAGRRVRAAAAFLSLAILATLWWCSTAPAQAGTPSVAFGPPTLIDALSPSTAKGISGISCGSETRCVAVGETFATSTSDAGGSGAPHWSHSRPISVERLEGGVSCAADGGCVAVAGGSGGTRQAVTSADYGETWSEPTAVKTASPLAFLTSISCALVGARHVCVAGDSGGGVSVSADGGRSWTPNGPSGGGITGPIVGMSCSEAGVCTGLTFAGRLLVATRFATESNPRWRSPEGTIDAQGGFSSLSCLPGGEKCVAADWHGGIYDTVAATSASPTWTPGVIEGPHSQHLEAVSCTTGQAFPAGLCVAVDNSGDAVISTEPWGADPSWSVVPTGDSNPVLTSVYCLPGGWCTAGDTTGGEIHATVDAGDPSSTTWSPRAVVNGVDELTGVSCVAGGRCAAVDKTGHALISEDDAGTWSGSTVDPGGKAVGPVSCAGDGGCVAVRGEDAFVAADGFASWSEYPQVDPGHELTAVSCAQAVCMAIDGSGDAVVAEDPGGSPRWSSPSPVGDGATLTGVSCPSDELCVAVDGQGGFTFTTDPGAAAPTWSEPRTVDERVSGGGGVTKVRLEAISCPSDELCVAVDALGAVIHTTQPAVRRAWSAPSQVTEGSSALGGVSCPGPGLCVVVGSNGRAWYTTDPSVPAPTWGAASSSAAISAVSCVPGGICVGVDAAGRAQVATLGALSASATTLEFPATAVGVAGERTLSITDTGLGNLQVLKAEPVSDETGAFSVVEGGCLGARLSPGQTCDIKVAFRPTAVEGYSALLLVEGDDPSGPQFIGLTGAGYEPQAATSSPPASPTSPPPPSRQRGASQSSGFRLLSAKAGAHGSIDVRLALPGPGKVTVEATAPIVPGGSTGPATRRKAGGSTYAASVSRVVGRAGVISVRLIPKGAALTALRQAGRLRVRLSARFVPRHGAPASRSATVTVRGG